MLDDALLDVTNLGDIVIDPFLGSGSGLIAAQNTGRMCRGVELDPLYITVIMRRFEAATGNQAILVETGEAFGGEPHLEIPELALGAPARELAVFKSGDARRIIAAVFETLQRANDRTRDRSRPQYAHYAAHRR